MQRGNCSPHLHTAWTGVSLPTACSCLSWRLSPPSSINKQCCRRYLCLPRLIPIYAWLYNLYSLHSNPSTHQEASITQLSLVASCRLFLAGSHQPQQFVSALCRFFRAFVAAEASQQSAPSRTLSSSGDPPSMQGAQINQRRHLRARSSARPCKRQGNSGDQPKQSKQQEYTDCCSQTDSSMSVTSDVQMYSSADGDTQLESSLQCEEHTQCLSSPQDSDTSAQSFQDTSAFLIISPVPAVRQHPLKRPAISYELTGPSPAELPTYALGDTHCIAIHGGKQHHSLSFIARCISSATCRLLHKACPGQCLVIPSFIFHDQLSTALVAMLLKQYVAACTAMQLRHCLAQMVNKACGLQAHVHAWTM